MSAVPVERPGIWLPRRRHLVPVRDIATIAFVQNLGTGVSTTAAASTLAFAPALNGTAGNLVLLAAGSGGGAVMTAVSDTKGNLWFVDRTQGTAGGTASLARTYQLAGGLATTDTITVTYSATGANKVAAAMEFSGFGWHGGAAGPEQVIGATGTTATAVSSGASASTIWADQLIVGAVGWAGASQLTLTKGATYTASLEKDEGSGAFIGIALEYKIVSAVAAMTADGTLSGAPTSWNAICATYRAAYPASPRRAVAAIVRAAVR